MSQLFLITFSGISSLGEALVTSIESMILVITSILVCLRLNLFTSLPFLFSLICSILGCLLYLKIAFSTLSSISFVVLIILKFSDISRKSAMLLKKLLKTFATLLLFVITSPLSTRVITSLH